MDETLHNGNIRTIYPVNCRVCGVRGHVLVEESPEMSREQSGLGVFAPLPDTCATCLIEFPKNKEEQNTLRMEKL